MQALIYTRQSLASLRSVTEQEHEARQVCEREGWEVREVVVDLVGASRHSKGKRPGWARVHKAIAAREVDVLVTWECSRAQRDLSAYTALRDLCSAAGVKWCYSGRVYDMGDPDDRFRSGIDALVAEREVEDTIARVRRATRASAAAGRPHGRRLYGYRRLYDPTTGVPAGQEPHPDEAPVVRSIFGDYLSGVGLRTIARKLEEQGIKTNTGKRWADAQVRRALINPAYAARRVHQGVVVGPADWPALIDPEMFDRVQARLVAKRTFNTRQTGTARLLTGVGRCGICGGKVASIHDRKKRKVYCCKESFEVCRDSVKLDAYVVEAILERLADPDLADRLAGTPDPQINAARAHAAELRTRLDNAVARFVAGELTAATLARVEAGLVPEIAKADAAVRGFLVPIHLDVPTSGHEAWWKAKTAEQQREIVAALVAAVVILPTGKGRGRVFDPAGVRIEWRR